MDVIYSAGEASVSEVLDQLPDPPSYSAVRATLGILEEKGYLKHRKTGRRFIYAPTQSRSRASRSALKHLVNTFFDGRADSAVATLLELQSTELTPEELQRIRDLIEKAQKEGR
jgi:predicted transcriptional regulator